MQRKSTGMNKKAIAILGAIFILIVGTLGFLIYSKYSGGGQADKGDIVVGDLPANQDGSSEPIDFTDNTDGSNQQNQTDNQAQNLNGFVQLSDEFVISPILFFNGRGITYFDQSGKLFQADLVENSGNLELTRVRELVEVPYKSGITRILWPKQGNRFLAEIQNFGEKSWTFYNGDLAVYADLPEQVFSLDWMPGGNKIVYVWVEDGKATLNLSDPDTSNWQEISEMWELDNNISVSPDGENILYYRTTNAGTTNSINLTNLQGTMWKSLVKDGFNYGVKWSPDGKKFLFGKRDTTDGSLNLWVHNVNTGEVNSLNILSSVDKAAWDPDSHTVYAAGFANSAGASSDSEKIYKIDSLNFSQKEYDPGSLSVDASDLFLSSAADKLFFKNNYDGSLYYLDLTQ